MKKQKKSIGIEVDFPKEKCEDKNCPFHGELKIRGRIFEGEVVSKNTHKSVILKWERLRPIPKYERFEKRFSKISAHNPDCIDAQVGDIVKVMETKPISKTKHFVVVKSNKK